MSGINTEPPLAFRDHQIGQLLRTNPTRAAGLISGHLKKFEGAIGPSAAAIGVDRATLRRWINRLKTEGLVVGPVRGVGNPDLDYARSQATKALKARKRAPTTPPR